MTAFLPLLLALQSASSQQPPTPACLEILADSEGEMARAQDPVWRRKAIGKLAGMRAEHDRYRASFDLELAQNAKARDRLQRQFDRREIEEDDFKAARSELEVEARSLTTERDAQQMPACGF